MTIWNKSAAISPGMTFTLKRETPLFSTADDLYIAGTVIRIDSRSTIEFYSGFPWGGNRPDKVVPAWKCTISPGVYGEEFTETFTEESLIAAMEVNR